MYALDTGVLRKPTIRSGDHVFASNQFCVTNDPIGDQTWVLDRCQMVRHDSRNQDLARRQPTALPDAPLVLVPRIGGFDRIRSGANLHDEIDDLLQWSIRDVRHMPTAEAHVIAHAILRNALQRMIERLHSKARPLAVSLRTL